MKKKLLIVDDEAHIRMLLEQSLEELEDLAEDKDEELVLLQASNGQEALDMIRKELPQLVFLDVMMPLMNGMEVCRIVKKELALDEVYIVLLTAKGQEVDRQRGMEVGADQYMTKPFDPDALFELAREVMDV